MNSRHQPRLKLVTVQHRQHTGQMYTQSGKALCYTSLLSLARFMCEMETILTKRISLGTEYRYLCAKLFKQPNE